MRKGVDASVLLYASDEAATRRQVALIETHHPFVGLETLSVLAMEDDASLGVSRAICSMGIQLASCITSRNIHRCEVSRACDLNVARSFDKLSSVNCTGRDYPVDTK